MSNPSKTGYIYIEINPQLKKRVRLFKNLLT